MREWRDLAFLCRYGHQDIYSLLGRDPLSSPLTPLERAILIRALQEHWEAEIKARGGADPDPIPNE